MSEWQDIATAPRDGSPVRAGAISLWAVTGPLYPLISCFIDGKWQCCFGDDRWAPYEPQPTVWQPLPPPPTRSETT